MRLLQRTAGRRVLALATPWSQWTKKIGRSVLRHGPPVVRSIRRDSEGHTFPRRRYKSASACSFVAQRRTDITLTCHTR